MYTSQFELIVQKKDLFNLKVPYKYVNFTISYPSTSLVDIL